MNGAQRPTSMGDGAAKSIIELFTEDAKLTSCIPIEFIPAPLPFRSDPATQDGRDSLLFDMPHCFGTAEHAFEHDTSRSRSPSPLGSPPPSFQDATATSCCDRDPPSYTRFDQNPQTDCYSPPPPYCRASKEKSDFSQGLMLDANSLRPSLPSDTKRGGTETSHLRPPILQA